MTESTPNQPSPGGGKPKSRASERVPPGGFQSPKGTRDFYPREMLVRRYITDAWRRTSLRHGFDEIDGPTFELADLYTVKSGDGILSELFSFRREGGEDLYALRPEFTPTLARLYAARAKQLPQPTKWFCVPSFFRAERPQRGRLREFFQWNCDVIGGEDLYGADAEVVGVAAAALSELGLESQHATARFSNRQALDRMLQGSFSVAAELIPAVHALMDKAAKMPAKELVEAALRAGLSEVQARFISAPGSDEQTRAIGGDVAVQALRAAFEASGLSAWTALDTTIVRGLAYYTGTVFEIIAEGERAVAGGGRYDGLIELFGGPPTPACGFGMGDVVLGNLLSDKGLIPEGRDMVEAVSRPMPVRPDVFVVASPNDRCADAVVPLVARLRRGVERERYVQSQASSDATKRKKPWSRERFDVRPLHARRSYKATKNVGKLLADAGACFARFAAIIEHVDDAGQLAGRATLKNLDTGEQFADVPLSELGARVPRGGKPKVTPP